MCGQLMSSVWMQAILGQLGMFGWILEWAVYILTSKWVLQCLWIPVVLLACYKTSETLDRWFPGLNPLLLYRWPFDVAYNLVTALWRVGSRLVRLAARVLRGVTDLYKALLVYPTRWCSKLGVVGDVLLIPIALAWMFWPLHVPFQAGQRSLLFSAVPLAGMLCGAGVGIVKANFHSKLKTA